MQALNNSSNSVGAAKPPAGFRLKRMEILNWGTFHGKINILAPDGRWSLMVGDNGSGKSTAVDALRTLLVPTRLLQGSYNDAARDVTAKRKVDRSRRSYIRGAWTTTSREESATGDTQFLRAAGVQSLLLAVFSDQLRHRDVTVAQILWELNDKPDEVYAIAEGDKNIKDHLAGIEELRDIRRHLKSRGFSTPGSYTAYCDQFRRLLGIPDESALEVFNQAIGVKEVEDLNKFIRQHLLNGKDAVDFIRGTLRPHYVQLDECHKAIQVAEQQIEILTPIADHYSRIDNAMKEKEDLQRIFYGIPLFFDWKCHELLKSHIDGENQRAQQLTNEKEKLATQQTLSEEQRNNVSDALARDETEIRIKRLELDIREVQAIAARRRARAHELETPLKLLGEPIEIETEEIFASLQARVTQKCTTLKQEYHEARQRAIAFEADKREINQRLNAQRAELQHLQKRKVLISERLCRSTRSTVSDSKYSRRGSAICWRAHPG
jgi:uncharacterized protein YPO0396